VILARFKERHAGIPVALLANGATLAQHDLSRLPCSTIGMNRSYDLHWSYYHVCLEKAHADRDPVTYAAMARDGRLFVAGEWPMGHVMPILSEKVTRFSRDLEQGVVTQIGDIGSVAFVAVQVAAYLGFRPLYFLGLDLGGDHFHGDWPASKKVDRQRYLFRHVPLDIADEVYVVGSPDSPAPFKHLGFEEALEDMKLARRA
jgi:hypothetical protein